MKHAFLVLGIMVSASAIAGAQQRDPKIVESRFHRIHLRNGNVVDGQLIKFTPTGVLLKVKFGEFEVRNDLIARTEGGKLYVEFIKLRSIDEKPLIDEARQPKKVIPPKAEEKPDPFKRPNEPKEVPVPESEGVSPDVRRKVDMLLRRMIRMNEDERVQVIQELIKLGPNAAIHIAENLSRIPESIRSEASEALIAGNTPQAMRVIVKLLESEDPSIRTRIVHSIGAMGKVSYARHLRPMLKDKDATVRGAAVVMLGRLDDRSSFSAIAALSGDPDENVRTEVFSTLYKSARKHGQEERLLRTLVSRLRQVRGKARADMISAVARLAIKESWQDLAPFLSDSAPVVRQSVAVALGKLNASGAGRAILDRLPIERDRWTRVYLATCVQKFRLKDAIDPLIDWLRDRDEQVRKIAAVTLQTLTNQNLGPNYEAWSKWRKGNSK